MSENSKPLPLGQLLIAKGKITEEQLSASLKEQKNTGDRLGHTLVKFNYITDDDLIEVLEEQFGIPAVKINIKMLNPKVVKTIPENIKRTNLNSVAYFHILQLYISAQAKTLSFVRQLHALMTLMVLWRNTFTRAMSNPASASIAT